APRVGTMVIHSSCQISSEAAISTGSANDEILTYETGLDAPAVIVNAAVARTKIKTRPTVEKIDLCTPRIVMRNDPSRPKPMPGGCNHANGSAASRTNTAPPVYKNSDPNRSYLTTFF